MKPVKRLALAAVGVGLLATLTGCGSAIQKSTTPVAQAASGFMETEKVDGLAITLVIPEPIKAGENRIVVTLDKEATAVEAQVVMAGMGHGSVVDLNKAAASRFEATTAVMNMEGKWLIRVKVTLPGDAEKDTLFYVTVKP